MLEATGGAHHKKVTTGPDGWRVGFKLREIFHKSLVCLAGLAALAGLLAAGCGGSSGGGATRQPQVITVTVSPSAVLVAPNGVQQFTATVTGTSNLQVHWSVTGAGCGGDACGTINSEGRYTAPGVIPDPDTVTVRATSAADPSRFGAATVTIGIPTPVITTLLPSSLRAPQPAGVDLTVIGSNFIAGVSGAVVLVNGSERATNCQRSTECFTTLTSADLALAGSLSVQVRNPGDLLSTPVGLLLVARDTTEDIIELTQANREAAGLNIEVISPSNAGSASPPPPQSNITLIGLAPNSFSCGTVSGRPLKIPRPVMGTVDVFICLSGSFLAAAPGCCSISGPVPINDILLSNPTSAGTAVVVTLTISSTAQLGPRTIFVTNSRGDIAATAGAIEILP
jgi:hypothetical protein